MSGESSSLLRTQELCESGGGRPGFPVLNNPYGLCGCKAALNSHLCHRCEFYDCIFFSFSALNLVLCGRHYCRVASHSLEMQKNSIP